MNESDFEKLNFIRVNLQVENLTEIIQLIERSELVKAIEMVPEEQKGEYRFNLLLKTLGFLDFIQKEQLESIASPNGTHDL